MSLLPDHVKETGALRPVELLRAVNTSDQLGLAKREGEPNAAAVADEAREPAALFLTRGLGLGLGVDSRRRRRRGGSHARRPFHRLAGSPAVNQPLGGGPWVSAAYAEEQPWTRDPRGSRVQSYSPRIPHGKVTKWQSTRMRPCQGAIID
jgi:hypothetical protein